MPWIRPEIAACLLVLLSLSCSVPALAEPFKGATSAIVVNAPQETVWKVLTTDGNFDDKYTPTTGNEAIAEQKFKSLPLFSAITVIMKATITPEDSIEFKMLKCDRLKDFYGGYKLAPVDQAKTKVRLSLFVDPGLPLPRFLVNKFVEGKVKHRLRKVKMLAEKSAQEQAPRVSSK